jgi:hypothetical protein
MASSPSFSSVGHAAPLWDREASSRRVHAVVEVSPMH